MEQRPEGYKRISHGMKGVAGGGGVHRAREGLPGRRKSLGLARWQERPRMEIWALRIWMVFFW